MYKFFPKENKSTIQLERTDLDDRVMDVDGGHGEMVLLGQLVESVNPRHTLLYHTPHVLGCPGELGEEPVSGIPSVVQDHRWLPPRCLG